MKFTNQYRTVDKWFTVCLRKEKQPSVGIREEKDCCPCLEIRAEQLEGTINHAEKERGLPGFY